MKDAYAVLGVPRSASRGAIHRRYRQVAKRLHPDRNPAPDAAERFRELHDAYATLSDADSRAALDSRLAGHAPPPPASSGPRASATGDPIAEWRRQNRSVQRTINTVLGALAGGLLWLQFFPETGSGAMALASLFLAVGGGMLLGSLRGKLDP